MSTSIKQLKKITSEVKIAVDLINQHHIGANLNEAKSFLMESGESIWTMYENIFIKEFYLREGVYMKRPHPYRNFRHRFVSGYALQLKRDKK